MSFRIERGQIIPIQNNNKARDRVSDDFQSILNEAIKKKDSIKISAHAQQRMVERNINLEEADMMLIKEAMNNLERKGARESLMLYKDVVLIASINNRTIITAIKEEEMDIVTNIDSAILVR